MASDDDFKSASKLAEQVFGSAEFIASMAFVLIGIILMAWGLFSYFKVMARISEGKEKYLLLPYIRPTVLILIGGILFLKGMIGILSARQP